MKTIFESPHGRIDFLDDGAPDWQTTDLRAFVSELGYELERLQAANAKLIEFVHDSAQWHDGPVVNSSFDGPGEAKAARELLAELGEKPRCE